MAEAETANEIVKSGNTFVLRFMIVLALTTYLIVPRAPEAQRKINQSIGEGQRQIDLQRRELEQQLTAVTAQQRMAEAGAPVAVAAAPEAFVGKGGADRAISESARARLVRRLAVSRQLSEQAARTARDLREKIIRLDQDYVSLEKARVIRQVSLPGTSFTLLESDVRMLYPGGIAIGLLMVLWYRRRLAQAPAGSGPIALPFWAAPVPLRGNGREVIRSLVVNVGGLAFAAFLFSLYMDFTQRDEFYPDLRVAALQLLLGLAVIGGFVFEFITALRRSLGSGESQ